MTKQLLTTRQAAEQANVGVEQVRRWVRERKLPCYRDHRNRILFDPHELQAFIRPRRESNG